MNSEKNKILKPMYSEISQTNTYRQHCGNETIVCMFSGFRRAHVSPPCPPPADPCSTRADIVHGCVRPDVQVVPRIGDRSRRQGPRRQDHAVDR